MKAIRKRVCFLALATGVGVLVSVLIFFEDATLRQLSTESFLVVAILATVFLFSFLIWANRQLKTAKLIIENQILHIQPALIDASTCGGSNTTLTIGGIEVFISCFGILLDSKVIKFNLDGIRLKAVEIGCEVISLTYGTDEQNRKIRILHELIDNQELNNIVEKFRYETGVIPTITGE